MPKFKRGDDVICIDNEFATERLTVKKVYKVDSVGCSSGRVRIKDDQLKLRFFDPGRFVSVDEHREQVIAANVKALEDAILYGSSRAAITPVKSKKLKPVSVVLTREVVAKALTKMIKEDFGIDAEVTGVQPRPNRDLELLLK